MDAVKKFLYLKKNEYFGPKEALGIRQSCRFSDARTIGVLFLIPDDRSGQAVNDFVARLVKEKKTVKAVTYREEASDNPYNFPYHSFGPKDLSLGGRIKDQEILDFVRTDFDFLFCIALGENAKMFEPLLTASRAKCRVGLYDEKHTRFFELMLDAGENPDVTKIGREMLNYTAVICKN